MVYFAASFGLLLYAVLWGTGLALLITPRPYRRYWVYFAAPAGLALQSAVVWVGAFAGLPGTESYARLAIFIPLALLGWALAAPGRRAVVWPGFRAGWGAGLAAVFSLAVLIAPLAIASGRLTTSSLGSCDAADYAAGARTLMEFARGDRTGFLGLTEVVRVGSVDNFYDFWLRLNHFTPPALVALNASALDLQPHELISVAAAVLLALAVPVVFWVARDMLRLGQVASGFVALLYGLSPLNLYAVYHVAMGQLLAAPAIALLTWVGVTVWQEGASWRRGLAWAGLLYVAYWLILGSYNFIIVVSLTPALAFAGGMAVWSGRWRQLGRWMVVMLVPLGACSLVFTERVLGLAERFRLFRQFDFGWRIPALSPEGWYGLVAGTRLGGYDPGLRLLASVLLGVVFVAALVFAARRRSRVPYLAVCILLPVLIGYGYLHVRGLTKGSNASYDAYKLFAVFYACVLPTLYVWFLPGRRSAGAWRWLALALATLLVVGNALVVDRFVERMRMPPLVVGRELAQLATIEREPRVHSINMLITSFWSRLWANAFLLRKPQYFQTHTYEGRLNTRLKGDWDLRSYLFEVIPPCPEDRIVVNRMYSLVNTSSPYFVRPRLNRDWYDIESLPLSTARWCWSRGDAGVEIGNPHSYPLSVRCRLVVQSVVPRDMEIWLAGRQLWSGRIDDEQETVWTPVFVLSPGRHTLELRSRQPPVRPRSSDQRLLGIGLFRFELHVQPNAGTGAAEPS
jgi:hypothetical protein